MLPGAVGSRSWLRFTGSCDGRPSTVNSVSRSARAIPDDSTIWRGSKPRASRGRPLPSRRRRLAPRGLGAARAASAGGLPVPCVRIALRIPGSAPPPRPATGSRAASGSTPRVSPRRSTQEGKKTSFAARGPQFRAERIETRAGERWLPERGDARRSPGRDETVGTNEEREGGLSLRRGSDENRARCNPSLWFVVRGRGSCQRWSAGPSAASSPSLCRMAVSHRSASR